MKRETALAAVLLLLTGFAASQMVPLGAPADAPPLKSVMAEGNLSKNGMNMSFNEIVSLSHPNAPRDAATKGYVDGQIISQTTDDQNLSEVLSQGNSAGSNNINLDGNEIVDDSGSVTLGGGNVDIADGSVDIANGDLRGKGDNYLSMDNTGYIYFRANRDLTMVSGGTGSDAISFRDPGHGTWMLRMFEGGPYTFKNSVTGDDMLRMNSSSGSGVEIPNGDLNVSGQLSAGSTECASDEYLAGDGTCQTAGTPNSLVVGGGGNDGASGSENHDVTNAQITGYYLSANGEGTSGDSTATIDITYKDGTTDTVQLSQPDGSATVKGSAASIGSHVGRKVDNVQISWDAWGGSGSSSEDYARVRVSIIENLN